MIHRADRPTDAATASAADELLANWDWDYAQRQEKARGRSTGERRKLETNISSKWSWTEIPPELSIEIHNQRLYQLSLTMVGGKYHDIET